MLFYLVAVVVKDGIQQAAHVFQHHGLRAAFIEKAEGFRATGSALVLSRSVLLSGLGKRRAGHAAGDQVNAFVWRAVQAP